MSRAIETIRTDRRGVAALELALIAPIMLILFFGTVEVTQLVRAYNKLGLAAQSIQNMVAGQNTTTVATITNDALGGQLVMTPFSTPNLSVTVASVNFNASGGASTLAWQVLINGAASLSVSTACNLAASLGLGSDSVIIVRAAYHYTPILSHVLASSYVLSQTAYGRPRNIATISGTSSSGAATGNC